MILVIRISGLVEVSSEIEESLFRIHLRRKYSATLLEPTHSNLALLKKIRNFVAYGNVDESTIKEIVEKRGEPLPGKKVNLSSVSEQASKKKLSDLGLKPFFRLHPPRGGIDSKQHFPQGVLGDHKEKINDLIRRML